MNRTSVSKEVRFTFNLNELNHIRDPRVLYIKRDHLSRRDFLFNTRLAKRIYRYERKRG